MRRRALDGSFTHSDHRLEADGSDFSSAVSTPSALLLHVSNDEGGRENG